jgi:hypothetical protein
MWANFLQYVDDSGSDLREVGARARMSPETMRTTVGGMKRWGYVVATKNVVTPTGNGRRAKDIWQPLPGLVEARWVERFGAPSMDALRSSLSAPDSNVPAYFPIARFANGLIAEVGPGETPGSEYLGLVTQLSQTLLAATFDYERASDVSLALSANVLRVLDANDMLSRDVPRATGVSKEAITFALGYLEKRGSLVIEPGRSKRARLTAQGHDERLEYKTWCDGFDLAAVRAALEPLVGDGDLMSSPLAAGLRAPPGTWRAASAEPQTLPHHPLVLHRGGFPDGS